MAVVANDIVFVILKQTPEYPESWWPVACFSTRVLAEAYIAAKTTWNMVVIDTVIQE